MEIRASTASGSCGRPESASGSQGVWDIARDGAEDAGVRGAARLPATAAYHAAQAWAVAEEQPESTLMLRRNSLKQKLSEKKTVIGIFLEIPEPAHVEIAGLANMDFVIIDWEHGSFSRESALHAVRAADSTGISPVIRVGENAPLAIQQALDIGAVGVQIPHVSEKEAALSACQAARFYPRGKRGLNPFVRSASYYAQNAAGYLKYANEDVLVIGQIEGVDGVRNLSDILTVEGLDVIFLGPYDLSQSLGIPGELDHPRLIAAMKQVIEVAARTDVVVGTFADSPERALTWIKLGVRYVAVSTDSEVFLSATRCLVDKIRKEL